MLNTSFSDIVTILSSKKDAIMTELIGYVNECSMKPIKTEKPFDFITLYDVENKYITENSNFISSIPKEILETYKNIYILYINMNVVTDINEYMYRHNTTERLIYTIRSNNLVCIYTDQDIKNLEDSDTILCNKNMKIRMFNMSDDVAYFMVFDK